MRARRMLVPLLIGALVAACSGGGDDGGDAGGYVPGVDASFPGGPRVTSDYGAAIEARYSPDEPRTVTVLVDAPDGAREMQVSTDASFGDADWQPVAGEIDLPVADTGYVQVFARFRASEDAEPTDPIVAGVQVDPSWQVATAASPDVPHAASLAGLAAPDVLVVRVETGRIVRGGQEPYPFSSPVQGDEIVEGDDGELVVVRDGVEYGTQIAPGVDVLHRRDTVVGYPLDAERLRDPSRYSISSDDAAIGDGARPMGVEIVTRPTGVAETASGEVSPAVHDIYLRLPAPAKAGSRYDITFPDNVVAPLHFELDPHRSRSFAVHANQVGYRPSDPLKVAYVSAWNGQEIPLPAPLAFSVVDADDGHVVLEGTSRARTAGADGELFQGDLTGTSVQELDFSSLDEPGTYRVCVDTLGCSFDFVISEESTWRRVAVAVARAMYHQRSGTALGQPYTSVERPRGFHPDDGIEVRQAQASAAEIDAANESDDGGFGTLVESGTDEIVPQAWGGHFDAGDWDRRIQHLAFLRAALDLVEQYPDTWEALELDIPESGDAVPDVIDEGLWDLDLYRRLQMPDGAIRGGIESEEHPLPGQTSWTQTQQVFAF
ncbi:MAG TPA: cellulase N-terminal Ig-like domain-containing protein, partial [Acidimicrobiales bacterium]